MKKLALILTLSILVLSGCGSKDSNSIKKIDVNDTSGQVTSEENGKTDKTDESDEAEDNKAKADEEKQLEKIVELIGDWHTDGFKSQLSFEDTNKLVYVGKLGDKRVTVPGDYEINTDGTEISIEFADGTKVKSSIEYGTTYNEQFNVELDTITLNINGEPETFIMSVSQ